MQSDTYESATFSMRIVGSVPPKRFILSIFRSRLHKSQGWRDWLTQIILTIKQTFIKAPNLLPSTESVACDDNCCMRDDSGGRLTLLQESAYMTMTAVMNATLGAMQLYFSYLWMIGHLAFTFLCIFEIDFNVI